MQSFLMRFCLQLALIVGLAVLCQGTAAAQTPDTPRLETTDRFSAALDTIGEARARVDAVRSDRNLLPDDDEQLLEIQLELEDVVATMREIVDALQPRVDGIRAREEALGPAPGENEPAEPSSLVEERRSLANDRALINAAIGDATSVSDDAGALVSAIASYRRDLFTQRLFGRTELSWDSIRLARNALVLELIELRWRLTTWQTTMWRDQRGALLMALFLSAALGALFVVAEYQVAARLLRHDPNDPNPSAFAKNVWAFWSTLLPVLALLAFLSLMLFFLQSFRLLRPDIAAMLTPFFEFLVVLLFVSRLADAVLSPSRANWRLVHVSDRGARLLWWLVVAMALVNAGDYLAGSISELLRLPLILTVAKGIVAAVIIGLILVIASFIHPVMDEDGASRPWPRPIALPLRALGIALILLPLFGYVGLARFAATQIVITGALLVTMYLGFRAAKAVSDPEAFAVSPLGRLLSTQLRFGSGAVEQFGLLAGLSLYLLVLAVGVPIIFLIWGYQPRDIQNWVQDSLGAITIGSVTISITGILLGVLFFVVGYFTTRWFQRWVDDNVMQRGRIEPGLRNSIRTGIGYLGVAAAAVVGASVAGLNLTNLALVAGALSLGIGFGLQNIVNNFVSGLILLAERPFKVGDWVETASTQGFVKHISVRATEIETFQRQSVIVPNSELINSPVGNWTHRNHLGRADIAVGVSYASDPRRVLALLEEIGRSNDLVLRDPPPAVLFMGFGESSLDFELRVFLRDVLSELTVGSDLRLKIFERFKDEGIEIPFPQRDLHVKLPPGLDESTADAAKEALQAASAKRSSGASARARPGGDDPDAE